MRSTLARLLPCLLLVTSQAACSDHEPEHAGANAAVVLPGLAPRHPPSPETAPPARPKLVVLVVVDQMRFDYFERLGPQWNGGFARLRDEGRVFSSAYHEHALTETAPGHATISTGNDPARHGIVANRWYDRATKRKVNAVDDPQVEILGHPDATGVSAATLLRPGIGDQLQAEHPDAVVISMAVKDRAAILLGAKHPDAAIWYDDSFGGFTTSTYYGDARPAWVDAYNGKDRAQALYGDHGWTLSRPEDSYAGSRRVTDPTLVSTYGEYALTKEFPHVIASANPDSDPAGAGAGAEPRNVIRDTPFADQMTLELAREAIAAEHMGADEVPDLLLIGLSGGDYAGHRYGPNSAEMQDYYLRTDAALGAFIEDLDANLGANEYVLILTADHGVVPMPEYSGIPGAGRFESKQHVPALLEKALELRHTDPPMDPPELALSHGVDLSFAAEVSEADRAALRSSLAALIRAEPLIADVWTRDELAGTDNRNEFADAWRRSFHPERSSDLLLQYAPGVVSYPEGTGHGTPYEYDQHVPLIIRGQGWSGVGSERVATVDIAPTIAAIIGIAAADGVDGQALAHP